MLKALKSCATKLSCHLLSITFSLSFVVSSERASANPDTESIQENMEEMLIQQINLIKRYSKQTADYQDSDAFNIQNCHVRLVGFENWLKNNFDKSKISQNFIKNNGFNLINNLFELRLDLRKKLHEFSLYSEFQNDNPRREGCIEGFRVVFRTLRYIEEYLAESLKMGQQPNLKVLKGESPTLMINHDFISNGSFDPRKDLRSGDILLSRGNAVTSAAIARIGDRGGQFSHVGIVYIDNEKKIWTVEAHIEFGSQVAEISKYLNDGKIRSVVYRHKNHQLAHQAAKIMFEKIKSYSDNNKGQFIPYDFKMNMDDENELFCSEITSLGFKLAATSDPSIKNFDIPLFKTKMNYQNRKFFSDIGIPNTVKEIFAPADIDLDPRFDLIAEWRDLNRTKDARTLDTILSRLYDWMENNQYQFKNPTAEKMLINFVYTTRQYTSFFNETFPRNMSTSALYTMTSLGKVGTNILEWIQGQETIANTDNPDSFAFTEPEIWSRLESLRVEDEQNFNSLTRGEKLKKDTKIIFHDRFRSNSVSNNPISTRWYDTLFEFNPVK